MKIIAFSGPQGSGKTTLLDAVYNKMSADGYSVYRDEVKTSRAVQKGLGWSSLEKVLESKCTMNEFQRLTHKTKATTINKLLTTANVDFVLTERCHADIIAYFQLWNEQMADPFSEDPDWVNEATAYQGMLYDGVVYVPFMDHVKFEHDPNRGFERDIVRFDELLKTNLDKMAHSKTYRVVGKSVDDRTNEVVNYLGRTFHGK